MSETPDGEPYTQKGGWGMEDNDAPWIVICDSEEQAERVLADHLSARVLNRSPALREMFDEGGLEKVLECGYLNAIADIQSGDESGEEYGSRMVRQMHHAYRAFAHLRAALHHEETP